MFQVQALNKRRRFEMLPRGIGAGSAFALTATLCIQGFCLPVRLSAALAAWLMGRSLGLISGVLQ